MSGAQDDALSDTALVAGAAAGDHGAFGQLVERHQASVFRLARAMTHSHEAAEDVLQQTFLAAWQSLPRFRGDASVRTWLLTIARHAAWHRRGEATRTAAHERPGDDLDATAIDELGVAAGWGADDPERQAIQAQCRDQLAAAMARLETDDRTILTVRELEGLSGEETAALLNLTLPAMKSRLRRARLRLAAEIHRITDARQPLPAGERSEGARRDGGRPGGGSHVAR